MSLLSRRKTKFLRPSSARTIVSFVRSLVAISSLILLLLAPTVEAGTRPIKDPRNWPTVTRLVMDRYELAGRVVSVRVYARRTDYFNCAYAGKQSSLMSFTLLGGPFETLTGYIPREMGRLMEGVLRKDPWRQITVQVQFEPKKLSRMCPDQVRILKWSIGWKYPQGSISPGKPDPALHPTAKLIARHSSPDIWKMLRGKKPRRPVDGIRELQAGDRLEFTAGARLSTAYHCMFKGAVRTHYALRLHDGKGHFIHAYVRRSPRSRQLVDLVALHRDVLLKVKGKIVKQAMSHYCGFQIDIGSWLVRPKTPPPARRKRQR